jgi:hypothetical protein
MTRVFVAQELDNVNLANLHQFGRVTYILEKGESVPIQSGVIEDKILSIKFDSGVDMYAASGKVALSHVILGTLVKLHGEIRTLLYDGGTKRYHSRLIGKCHAD